MSHHLNDEDLVKHDADTRNHVSNSKQEHVISSIQRRNSDPSPKLQIIQNHNLQILQNPSINHANMGPGANSRAPADSNILPTINLISQYVPIAINAPNINQIIVGPIQTIKIKNQDMTQIVNLINQMPMLYLPKSMVNIIKSRRNQWI